MVKVLEVVDVMMDNHSERVSGVFPDAHADADTDEQHVPWVGVEPGVAVSALQPTVPP